MNLSQKKRRDEFAQKVYAGKDGYSRQEIGIEDGNLQNYNPSGNYATTGQAALFFDGKLHIFDTNDTEKDFFIGIGSYKEQKLLIDVCFNDFKKSFDIGFKHDNSESFIFSAYFHTEYEEYLYVVDALDGNKAAEASCLSLITLSKNSKELLAAYNFIIEGIQHRYELETR